VLLTFASVAGGQSDPSGVQPAEAQPDAAADQGVPGTTEADLESLESEATKLTPAQMREKADAILVDIEAAKTRVGKTLGGARQLKDVVKTLCLDDKASQVAIAKITAEERRSALEEALVAGATDRAAYELTLMQVIHSRVGQLQLEAGQCIGAEATFTDDAESELSVEVDANLPEVDSNVVLIAPLVLSTPAISSPVD
jgi:hypothetical protein